MILISACTLICCILSILQFRQKGFLVHNAYIYATKEERETMNKKPYYRQSGIVFSFLTVIFFIIGLEVFLKTGWLLWIEGFLLAAVMIYAIISSVKLARE